MSVTTVPFSDYSGRNSEGTPCRLCMKKNDNYYHNIFTSNLASTMTVEDAIHELVGLRVAVDDGLPSALCPLCMEKLIEFSDFKKICLESDAELRKFSSRNYSRSIQEEIQDGDLGSSAVTKDCIPDVIMGTSRLACSVQTEIYIPVSDCQTSRASILKNGDQLNGGNYPSLCTPDPVQISSDVSDPLAIDDLFHEEERNEDHFGEDSGPVLLAAHTAGILSDVLDPLATNDLPQASTSSQGEEVDAECTGAFVIDLDCLLVTAKKEPSPEENDATEPTLGEDGDPIESLTMVQQSTTGAFGVPAPKGMPIKTASNSYLLAEGNVWNHSRDECIDPKSENSSSCEPTTSKAIYGLEGRKQRPKKKGSGLLKETSGGKGDKKNMRQATRIFTVEEKSTAQSLSTKPSSIRNPLNRAGAREKERPHSCSVCTKTFTKKHHLTIHIRTHTGEKPYSCSECEKSFSSSSGLISHIRRHTGEKPYSCNECEKSFSYQSHFARHLRTHKGEKPYSCGICNKSFTRRSTLKSHTRKHTGERPFSCNDCGKSFNRKDALISHMRTHTGHRPYSCKECGKSFSQLCSLKLHARKHE